jgi:hypothetical protein
VKRFTETTKWNDPWFMDLPVKYKAFWFYICDQCDSAGVWEPNIRLAVSQIGEPLELSEILRVFADRIEQLSDGKLWVTKFIQFQFGILSPDCKPHIHIIKRLTSLGLSERVSKGYPKGMYTLSLKSNEKPKGYPKGIHTLQDSTSTVLEDKDKNSLSSSPSTSNFIDDLKKNPFNAGIDVDWELQKAKAWCKKKGRRCTQRFFTNWIDRADRIVPDPPKKQTPKPNEPKPPEPTKEEIEHRKTVASQELKNLRDKFRMPP